jgi:hypothetical protein
MVIFFLVVVAIVVTILGSVAERIVKTLLRVTRVLVRDLLVLMVNKTIVEDVVVVVTIVEDVVMEELTNPSLLNLQIMLELLLQLVLKCGCLLVYQLDWELFASKLSSRFLV